MASGASFQDGSPLVPMQERRRPLAASTTSTPSQTDPSVETALENLGTVADELKKFSAKPNVTGVGVTERKIANAQKQVGLTQQKLKDYENVKSTTPGSQTATAPGPHSVANKGAVQHSDTGNLIGKVGQIGPALIKLREEVSFVKLKEKVLNQIDLYFNPIKALETLKQKAQNASSIKEHLSVMNDLAKIAPKLIRLEDARSALTLFNDLKARINVLTDEKKTKLNFNQRMNLQTSKRILVEAELNAWAESDPNKIVATRRVMEAIQHAHPTLNLSKLGLTSLPNSIGNLPYLRHLNVSGNQLDKLPSSVGNLTHLVELNISGNKFTSIPPDTLAKLGGTKINVSGNPLTSPLDPTKYHIVYEVETPINLAPEIKSSPAESMTDRRTPAQQRADTAVEKATRSLNKEKEILEAEKVLKKAKEALEIANKILESQNIELTDAPKTSNKGPQAIESISHRGIDDLDIAEARVKRAEAHLQRCEKMQAEANTAATTETEPKEVPSLKQQLKTLAEAAGFKTSDDAAGLQITFKRVVKTPYGDRTDDETFNVSVLSKLTASDDKKIRSWLYSLTDSEEYKNSTEKASYASHAIGILSTLALKECGGAAMRSLSDYIKEEERSNLSGLEKFNKYYANWNAFGSSL